jgi:hypothetical protein
VAIKNNFYYQLVSFYFFNQPLFVNSRLTSGTTLRIMTDQVILMVAGLCNLKNDY